MNRIRVILFPETCAKHGTAWNAHSDEPWFFACGKTPEAAVENYWSSITASAALQVERLGKLSMGECPQDMIRAPIYDLPTTTLYTTRSTNEVGLPHTLFTFYLDERPAPEEECGCVSAKTVLGVLEENGVTVERW